LGLGGLRFVAASLVAHGGVVVLLVGIEEAPKRPLELVKPLEISVVTVPELPAPPAPVPEPAPDQPRPTVASTRGERPRVRGVTPVTPAEPHVAPPAPPSAEGPTWLNMRPSHATPEVHVPQAWQIGRPEGAPPADQPPPGLLGGPLRPGGHPGRPLGPGVVPDGDGGYRQDRQTFVSRVDRDGTVHFHDRGNVGVDNVGLVGDEPGGMPGVAGHFDLTDALMRMHGEDPYRYEKQRFMDATRDERVRMARADRGERLREAAYKMPAYLEKVWAYAAWTEAQRRRVLFALWEEVAEDGDAELIDAGVAVRAAIVGFIQRRLPEGGPDAYSPDELEALNRRRRCHDRFEPYAR
jgi:hypothetical protein